MLLHTDTFTHRHFYTQTLLTKRLLHTGAFTHRSIYTQTLLHTKTFTHSHTEAFTHRGFDTQALYTQTLVHTNTCSWKFQDRTIMQIDLLYISHSEDGQPKTSCKTSNDCHALMTTCSRPPESPKTSSTATKRSSGNAYSHVCSDSSGSKPKISMPTWAKKCDAKVLPTNSTDPKSVNPNVTSLIHSYHFGGKIKHAY